MTLTGPAPEVARDRWGRPLIVPPQPLGADPVPYTRATTIAKTLDDSSGLMVWKQRMTLLGAVARRDLLTAAAATDVSDSRTLNRLAGEAAEAGGASAAATTGTALHAFTERLDTGQPLGHVPPEYADDLAAYADLGERVGWTVHGVEEFLVLDGYKVAGTADRVLEIDGVRYIADIKTGSSVGFPHAWAMQLAVYAHGVPYDIGTRQRRPWDVPVNKDRALIVHIPAGRGKASAHWLDIAAGWEQVPLAMKVREWRKRRDLLAPWEPPTLPADVRDPVVAAIATAGDVDALTAVWAAHKDSWTGEHTALAAARKKDLTAAAA